MKRILRKLTATLLVLALCIGMIPGIPIQAHGTTYTTSQTGLGWHSGDIFVIDGNATYSFNSSGEDFVQDENREGGTSSQNTTATISGDGRISMSFNSGTGGSANFDLPGGYNAWQVASFRDDNEYHYYFTATNYVPPAVDPTVTVPTLASALTYDSTAQQLITAAAASNSSGEISYGLGASDSAAPSNWYTGITNSNLKGTDAGTYYIWYKQAAATGYNAKAATYVGSVTISKAANPLTYTSAQTLNKNFNSLEQTATLTAAANGEGAVTYAILNQKDSSNNTVAYFSLDGSSNTLVIAANTPVGAYTVNVRATAAGNGNYESGTMDSAVTVNIGQAAPTVTAPTANTLTYDGTEQQLITAGSTNGGTLQYSLNGTDYVEDPTTLTATAAGIYTVYYKVTGDANYSDVAAATVPVTIKKKDIIISGITAGDKTYDGDATATLNFENVVFGGIIGDDTLTVTAIGAFTDAGAGAGKTVNITGLTLDGANIANYKLAASGQQTTATATIAKLAITIKAKDQTVALDGNITESIDEVSITAGTLVDGHSITAITLTDSGTSAITENGVITPSAVTIKDGSSNTMTGNYEVSYESGVLTVTKAAPTFTAPTANTLTYDGTVQELANAGTATGGTVWYRLGETGTWAESVPSAKSATTYTIYYYIKGDANHSDLGSESAPKGSIEATIAQKEVVLSWTSTAFAYDGNTHTPTATVENLESGDTCTVTVTGGAIEVGSHTATATALSNGNYKLPATVTQTFSVSGAKVVNNDDSTVTAPRRGDTLKAVLEPAAAGDSYQWYRGSSPIDGATSATYTLTNDDVGKNIKAIITKDGTTFTTAYVGPVAQVHDIEVAISSDTNANVTLKLKKGTVQIGSSQTVTLTGSGPYTGTGTFGDVPDGVYNIVATQGTKTVTAAVTISGTAATTQVSAAIPSDDVNSILDVKNGAPAVVAAGLDHEAQDNKENGQSVTIEMTVEDEAAGTAEATAIKAQSDQTNTSGKGAPTMTYMDVSVTKTVGASAPEAVHETQDIIELIIPFNVTGRTIWMWRNHQDTVQKLTNNTTHGEGTFWTDAVNNLIHLYAKKYSVYAIGYVEGTVNTGGGSGGSGGGGGGGATGVVPTPSTTPAAVETPAIEVVPAPESIRWCLKDATCPIDKFPDAYTWEWYHDGVHWALSELVMKGFDDGFFYPGSSTTRAQVATMLWRLAGCPVVDYQMTFADVPSYEWFVEQVRWAAANGIITGFMYGGYDVFDPNGPITREQLAAMIYRFAKLNGIATADAKAFKLNFTDAGNLSDYASDAMKWMVSQGIITGTADESGKVTLDPQGNASRAQIATMFMRYCTKFIQR